jgi:GDP-D-mannose 3',5'-epimerase
MKIAGKKLFKKHIPGPLGVPGRTSDNRLIYQRLKWRPTEPLEAGLRKTYNWIENQVKEVFGNANRKMTPRDNRKLTPLLGG